MRFTCIGLIALFLISSVRLNAQENEKISFDRISSEMVRIDKGLSQNTVFCILQDRKGFMWFGAWDGLNRFDGYHFSIYNRANKLSNQTIKSLYEDENGILWIGTEDGLNRFDRSDGTIKYYYTNPSNNNSISNNSILNIIEDAKGFLWIGTSLGLNKFDKEKDLFFAYFHDPLEEKSLSNNHVNQVFEDSKGRIWVATAFGLNLLQDDGRFFKQFFHSSSDPKSLSSSRIWSLAEDVKGNIWVGTNNGLNRLDPENGTVERFLHDPDDPSSLSDNRVVSLLFDRAGRLWIGTDGGGVNLMDMETGEISQYFTITNDAKSLSNNNVLSIYEDRAGTIWVGTFNGVNKIDRSTAQFVHVFPVFNEKNSLNSSVVYSIFLDDNNLLWIGTDEGINLYDRNTNKFTFIQSENNGISPMPSNLIRLIKKDSKENYWIGTRDKGIIVLGPDRNFIRRYYHKPLDKKSISSNAIWSFFEDHKGRIWIGTQNGLNLLRPDGESFVRFYHKNNASNSLPHNSVYDIHESKSTLWFATYGGLCKYNESSKDFTSFIAPAVESISSVNSNRAASITEDHNGLFWICTMGGGLCRFDPGTLEYMYYTVEDGLPNNVIYNALEDELGNFWISTNDGLTKFNPESGVFVNYGPQDGIQGSEFNVNACFQSENGEMFFGGMNGFNSFFPSQIKKNTRKPPLVFSSFKVFNEIRYEDIEDGDTIYLNWRDNFFSFEFAALDFTKPSKNQYSYRMENYDKGWVMTDARKPYAEYTNVDPGTYRFRVKGSNNDGVWNEEGISLIVVIKPPWYGTLLFKSVLIIVFAFLLWYLVYSQFRRIRKKHGVETKLLEVEKQMVVLEQQALRLQMNPHFIFNSLNSIQSFVISNDTDKAIRYLAKFSQLMRLILSNSRESYIPIKDEIKTLRHYLDIERLRFDDKFDYSINLGPEIDEDFMDIPPMIFQPYVENAIVHGILHKEGQGNIRISLKLKGDHIFCSVEDDGVGRKRSWEIQQSSDLGRKSRGMLITKKRLEILNQQTKEQISVKVIDLYDAEKIACGTRVELYIRYKEV